MFIKASSTGIAQSASTLRSRSSECRSAIAQIAQTMNETASVWQGRDCQTFVSQANALRPQLERLCTVMEDYASILTQNAQIYDQLENDRAAMAARLL